MKTLGNTTASQAKNNVSDIVFWGNGDTFKLISKASSKKEKWMKSTKAMEIDGVGCVVQVTTQQGQETGVLPFRKNEDGSFFIKDGNIYPELDVEKGIEASQYVIAEAVTFVPGVKIFEEKNEEGIVVSRKLVAI